MIFGIGLPRSGGQSLQQAISILTGKRCWHSIQADRWDSSLQPGDAGAVEVYAPIGWLDKYHKGYHTFIYNCRDPDDWLKSCAKVYERSQRENWNHPIWRYPLDQFEEYLSDYEWMIQLHREDFEVPIHSIDIIADPTWDHLCEILGLPVPDVPFPNTDRMRPVSPDVVPMGPMNFGRKKRRFLPR